MMSSSNNRPPPPSYDEVTSSSFGNKYNTQYSDPSRDNNVQPLQPQPFGQPQGFGQPPLPSQPPPPRPSVNQSPLFPFRNQQNATNLPGQVGQPQSFRQPAVRQPATIGVSPNNARNRQFRRNVGGQQQELPGEKREELIEKAVAAMMCFFPLGIWAFLECLKVIKLYAYGNISAAKRIEEKFNKISSAAIGVGVVIIITLVLFYFGVFG